MVTDPVLTPRDLAIEFSSTKASSGRAVYEGGVAESAGTKQTEGAYVARALQKMQKMQKSEKPPQNEHGKHASVFGQ